MLTKKSVLFLLPIVPLLLSCNNNPKGFVDPFPNDNYYAVGFDRFADDEYITRTQLSQQETTRLKNTQENNNDAYIYEHRIEIHERNYLRAFSGEFQEGYNVSNYRIDSLVVSYRNNSGGFVRSITESNSTAKYDYYYGRNTSIIEEKKYIYFASDSGGNKYNEVLKNNASNLIETSVTSGAAPFGVSLVAKSGTWDDDETNSFLYAPTSQQKFISNLDDYSTGANQDGVIILTKQEREDYHDDSKEEGTDNGIFETKDGRRYLAKKNSVTVVQLVSQGSWYLVSKVREYQEIAITSESIQPNVPITMRNQKIIISYSECIHNFYVETTTHSISIPTNVPLKGEE